MRVNGFKYGGLWPLSWTISARNLKRAADKLFEIYYNASMRDLSREINLAKEALIGKNDSTSMELEGEELDDFNDEQMISVYFFLIGLALENLIKGILLTLNPTYLSDTKLSNEIKTHNLLYLYNKCGLSLRNNDKTILIKLSRYILWLGRYPIPLSIDSMLPIKEDDGVVIQRGESHADILRTQEAIEDLYRRLMMKLNEAKDHAKI
jgi:hypothetical protein